MTIRALSLCLVSIFAAGCKKDEPPPAAPPAPVTRAPAAPSVDKLAVAPDSMKVDKVSGSDGPIATDGTNDGSFTADLTGAVASLALVTVEESGAIGGQEWDTIAGAKKLPAGYGDWNDGTFTYQLGVFEGGALKNSPDGALTLPDGAHHLALYAHDTGVFKKGARLQLLVERPDHTVQKSPVAVYP